MEYSIPIPRGKSGMERNGMEWNLEYSMVEPTSKVVRRPTMNMNHTMTLPKWYLMM
jgi:hypothetical protein